MLSGIDMTVPVANTRKLELVSVFSHHKSCYIYACVCFTYAYIIIAIYCHYQSIYYVETTEALSPPPYPSHLPSYEEILRLPSPIHGQVCICTIAKGCMQ